MSPLLRHKYDPKGHPRSYKTILCQNHSSTLSYGPILMKILISWRQFFHRWHFYIIEKFCYFFTLRPSDLNTTLTYVLMDNFCPCFHKSCKFLVFQIRLKKDMRAILHTYDNQKPIHYTNSKMFNDEKKMIFIVRNSIIIFVS